MWHDRKQLQILGRPRDTLKGEFPFFFPEPAVAGKGMGRCGQVGLHPEPSECQGNTTGHQVRFAEFTGRPTDPPETQKSG